MLVLRGEGPGFWERGLQPLDTVVPLCPLAFLCHWRTLPESGASLKHPESRTSGPSPQTPLSGGACESPRGIPGRAV